MELPYDLGSAFKSEPIERLDKNTLRWLTPRKFFGVQKSIDKLGLLSAEAQKLRRTLTSYDKILDSEEDQVLYLYWNKHPSNPAYSIVIGYLKIGYRQLYLRDSDEHLYVNTPISVLDFFVIESHRKQGIGQALFQQMLENEKVEPHNVAFDKPSQSLLQFAEKHYGLTDPVWQSTNFVIFPGFFDGLTPQKEANIDEEDGSYSARRKKDTFRSPTSPNDNLTPRARMDSAGGIIHGTASLTERKDAAADTPKGRKNTRDFGHQSIW